MARFEIGQLLATPGVLEATAGEGLRPYLARHAAGDWGVVGDADKRANDRATVDGTRLLSAYLLRDGTIDDRSDKGRDIFLIQHTAVATAADPTTEADGGIISREARAGTTRSPNSVFTVAAPIPGGPTAPVPSGSAATSLSRC